MITPEMYDELEATNRLLHERVHDLEIKLERKIHELRTADSKVRDMEYEQDKLADRIRDLEKGKADLERQINNLEYDLRNLQNQSRW